MVVHIVEASRSDVKSVRIDHAMFHYELVRYVVEYSRKMLNDMVLVINDGVS